MGERTPETPKSRAGIQTRDLTRAKYGDSITIGDDQNARILADGDGMTIGAVAIFLSKP